MIVVWSGWGFLVLPIVIVVTAVIGVVVQLAAHAVGYENMAALGICIGLVASALANWAIGRRLNGRPARELIDPKTNQRVLLRRRHTLFWIPMQYWSIAMLVAAVLVPLSLLSH